jgi:Na+-driven multidrug efflux pump
MLTIITSFLLIIGGDYAFGLFVRDAAVVALGNRIIRTTFPFYWLYVFLQVFGDSIKGAGKALPPTVIIMINITIIRSIILISLVPIRPDVRTIAVSYPVTWFLTAAQMLIYYMLSNRKKEKSCE